MIVVGESNNRYLYSVNPRKVIKDLPATRPIRAPRSLYLTKEQVLICMKSGSVYRRFANVGKIERVTLGNLDRLHQGVYMTEEEYNKRIKEKEQKAPEQEPVVTEPTVEKSPVVEQEEEIAVEVAPVEEVVQEEPVVTENIIDDGIAVDGFAVVDEPAIETQQQQQYRSYSNKKHRKQQQQQQPQEQQEQ